MGTNYYLKRRINYKPGDQSTLGIIEELYQVHEISNGFIWNNKYYKNLVDLNLEYFQYIHIGKSSGGWHFALHIYPKDGIKDIYDWKKLFYEQWNTIEDEEGRAVTADEMFSIITERAATDWGKWTQEAFELKIVAANNELVDAVPIGGKKAHDYDELLLENNAIRGLHGLWAHKPDKYTNNSDGTYDYITNDFS